MNVPWGKLVLGGILLGGGWMWWEGRPVSHPRGVLAPEDPRQEPLQAEDRPFEMKGYRLTPLARYHVTARVLSRERYWVEAGAPLSPVDFALGWGPMSNSNVLSAFSISQGGRWYQWSASEMPISEGDVITHSANTHLIPADAWVRRQLLAMKEGDVVTLEGYLVAVEGPEGFTWKSSLTRTDTGGGSCELMYVREASRQAR